MFKTKFYTIYGVKRPHKWIQLVFGKEQKSALKFNIYVEKSV